MLFRRYALLTVRCFVPGYVFVYRVVSLLCSFDAIRLLTKLFDRAAMSCVVLSRSLSSYISAFFDLARVARRVQ